MKFTQFAGLLALGLGASPAVASVCRPSKVSSVSAAPSVSPSSVYSTSPSASPSPSPSPSPAPEVCGTDNILVNGDFSNGMTGWNYYDEVTFSINTCGGGVYATCCDVYIGGGYEPVSQVVPTVVGATYTIDLHYQIIYWDTSIDYLRLEIRDPAASPYGSPLQQWTLPYDPTASTTTDWLPYTTTFVATMADTTFDFVVGGNYGVRVDFADISIKRICSE